MSGGGAVAPRGSGVESLVVIPTYNERANIERIVEEVLSLPIYPELTRAQLDEVVGAVRAFYGGNR